MLHPAEQVATQMDKIFRYLLVQKQIFRQRYDQWDISSLFLQAEVKQARFKLQSMFDYDKSINNSGVQVAYMPSQSLFL